MKMGEFVLAVPRLKNIFTPIISIAVGDCEFVAANTSCSTRRL